MFREVFAMSSSGPFLRCFTLSLVTLMAACERRPAPPPAPPPPAVTVSQPLEREVIEWDEYTGRLEPVESVEVRARVSGLVESAPFHEGAIVKKGDMLFTIDVRPFRAELDSKIADVAKAKAQLLQATSDFKRIHEAIKSSAVSE